ncbi:MAG: tRNA pseudouridine55 synthase [Patescibacteria group bacterium]|nr:tRNA pseudouridine55 synthase [Patescibacteria group bacterium]
MLIQAYKERGETPLDVLKRLKNENPEYQYVPMTYAGRLDPMAEGLMLVLTGDDCMKKDEYTNLSKEYEVTILFGFATDTYDLLGLVEDERSHVVPGRLAQAVEPSRAKIQQDFMCADGNNMTSEFSKIIKNFTGKIDQKYPPYSSRTVNGKPLFQWAREGRLDEITIPSHEVYISNIELIEESKITKTKLAKYIKENIGKIKGDFRQEEILEKWNEVLQNSTEEEFVCIKLKIACSSGTYVRVVAHELGESVGTQALAMHIKRTKIGDYSI